MLKVIAFCLIAGSAVASSAFRYWPRQMLPQGIVRTLPKTHPHPDADAQMMVQSVAGLAAKAINEGRGNELVWVTTDNIDSETWYAQFLAGHPEIHYFGAYSPWELVKRFTAKGIIKGYILYRFDRSDRKLGEHSRDMDLSVNVATSAAGLLDGIIVSEELEAEAKKLGLPLLLDVRDKTQKWCFDTYRDRFNRRMLYTGDPKKVAARDYAIANKTLALFGPDEPLKEALEWLDPLSPILGWNGGDEFETTQMTTAFGHIQTCTDWSINLPCARNKDE